MDGQSVLRIENRAESYLAELGAGLKDGSYRPEAVKRVEIPKGDGRTRPLGIPTVKDRIVQTAVKMVIEPVFEAGFCEGSAACPGEGRGLPSGTWLQGRIARGGPAVESRILLRRGCGYQELLRYDPA